MTDNAAAPRSNVGTHRRLCDALVSLGGPQIFLQASPGQRQRRQRHRSPPREGVRRSPFTSSRGSAEPSGRTAAADAEDTEEPQIEAQRPALTYFAGPTHETTRRGTYAALRTRQAVVLPGQEATSREHHLRLFSPTERASVGTAHNTLHPLHTPSCCVALRASYFQVVKESVVAFHGCRLHTQLLQQTEQPRDVDAHRSTTTMTAATLQHHHVSSSGAPSSTSRQARLRSGIDAYLHAVSQQEATLLKASSACKAHLERLCKSTEGVGDGAAAHGPPALPRHLLLAQLPRIPLQRWAGAQLYNGWHVRCSCCRVVTPPTAPPAAAAATRKGKAALAPPTVPSASLLPTPPPPPKRLVLPADVEQELRRYWKLRDEADARARLDALRCHNTEAFAQHVSLLKISALLGIMEKTEGFMRRIGLRLQAQAGLSEQGRDSAATPSSGAPPGHASEYERFRAYVASTKNEFKLMHRVDVFVAAQPPGLEATLLPHQMDGLRFLVSLDANHINGILADEMGVGKTIQTLAFLLHLKHQRASLCPPNSSAGGAATAREAVSTSPHLVLAPLSVIREWREACEQFVPLALRVALFQELPDPVHEAAQYDLLLLPVHAVRHVAAEAARVPWHYVVVDEAHKAVANLGTMTAQCIVGLPCRRRLVLTGTPLSSDLQELWSLLHFLNPQVFTDNDAFEEVFRRPFRVYGAEEMALTEEERGLLILRLHQVLRPFLLRRTKADIDTSLCMTFHRVGCPLTAMQRRLLCMLRDERRAPTMLTGTTSSTSSDTDGGVEGEEEAAAASSPPDKPASELPCARPTENVQTDTLATVPFSASNASARDHCEGRTDADALTTLVRQHLSGLAGLDDDDDLCTAVKANKALGLSNAGVSESAAQLVCNHAFLLPFFSQVLHRHGLDELAHEMDTPTGCGGKAVDLQRRDGTEGAGPARPRGAADLTLACSGKFLVLHLLLSRLYVAGHKAVLFTHWLDCVDLLAEYLQSRGWGTHTEVLTGASSEAERRTSVRRFREDPTCLFFLLSIKAGGCGINLQAAHMVVLLDRDYTVTNEDQALARVYRIGQRHTVRAVYLTTDDISEQRVAERAAEKNKPREAIIDAGVYQVRDSTAAAEVQPCGMQHVRDDVLWQRVSECYTSHGAAGDASDPSVAAAAFWVALTHFVEQLDDLVLTDEDRAVLASTETVTEVGDAGPVATRGAAARLRATRPPASTEELRHRLGRECEDLVAASTALSRGSTGTLVRGAGGTPERGAGDAALQVEGEGHDGDETAAADSCTQTTRLINPCDAAAASTLSRSAPPPAPPLAVAVTHPLHRSAHFWLEYAQLLRTARHGPQLLASAVDAAVRHDAAREDPSAHARRRERRARRAAKRLRLASLEVPDSFREACWAAHGIDDDAEVAARYMRHQDAQAQRGPLKRQRRR